MLKLTKPTETGTSTPPPVMNMEEDSDASDTTRVTSNNTNVKNYNNIVSRDVDDTEEYEPTDPDNSGEKITEILSWTHDDLAHNMVLRV
jgi:hypothetical protein